MDIQMPEMNGYEATREIRKLDNENQQIPIIALTASALVDEREKVLQCGMNEHLSKPFSPDQLRVVMEDLLVNSMHQSTKLDRLYLEELYEDDEAFKIEMFETFLKNVDNEMQRLLAAITKKRHKDVYQISHKNKSSFQMVGLQELANLLAEIEQLAIEEKDNQKSAERLKALLPDAIQCVKNELKKEIK